MKKLELYREFLKSKRPINEIILNKIEENLKAKFIYNSNGIEGNTLSLMETNLIIEHGVTIKGKSLKEHLEVKGQEYALNFLLEVMKEKEKNNETEFFDYEYVMKELNLLRYNNRCLKWDKYYLIINFTFLITKKII